MTTTPYDIIGKEALYDMIDYFYTTEFERDAWLENMQTAINRAAFPQGVGDYLFERLRLTANHMVNS